MGVPYRSLDVQDFRQALGKFCSGVTAITAATDLSIHGMTATAFSSLSLDPPLILSCVGNHARMHGILAQVRTFGVSILSQEQQRLSTHFAGRELRGEIAFEWRQGVPVMSGAVAQLVSTITARHREGDHTIYVGKVTGCWLGNGEPLLYYAGGYRKMAPQS